MGTCDDGGCFLDADNDGRFVDAGDGGGLQRGPSLCKTKDPTRFPTRPSFLFAVLSA